MSTLEKFNTFEYLKNVYLARFKQFWVLSAFKYFFINSEKKLTIVTASDSSHFKSLLNLLLSIKVHESDAEVHIWNLGLSEAELKILNEDFGKYKIFDFHFHEYPEHVRVKTNYAWKPILIFKEFTTENGLIIYLDAGDLLTSRLYWIKKFISSRGFFSPYSAGIIKEWTHPRMLKNLKIESKLLSKPNLNGAIIGFDSKSKDARKLILDWVDCALDRNCIAPQGSSRINHRYDQAALTCLAYANKIAPKGVCSANIKMLGLKIHQDVD